MYLSSSLKSPSSNFYQSSKATRKKKLLLYISIFGLLLISLIIALSIGVLFMLISKEEKELARFDDQMYSEIDSVFTELSIQLEIKRKEIDQCYLKMEQLAPKKLFDKDAKDSYETIIKELGFKYNLEKDKITDSFQQFIIKFSQQIGDFKQKHRSFLVLMNQVAKKENLEKLIDDKMRIAKMRYKAKFEFDANHCVSKEYIEFLLNRGYKYYKEATSLWNFYNTIEKQKNCVSMDYSPCVGELGIKYEVLRHFMETQIKTLQNPRTFLQESIYFNIEGKPGANEIWSDQTFKTVGTTIKIKKNNKEYLNVDLKQFNKGM